MPTPSVLDDLARGSAAPDDVRLVLEGLFSADPDAPARFAEDAALAQATCAIAAASRSLSRVVVADREALDVLAACREASAAFGRWDPSAAEDPADLGRRKRLVLLSIAARDLLGLDDLDGVGASLSALADAVLAGAASLSGTGDGLAIVAMGKHGAEELNYASDVDLLLVAASPADAEPAAAQRLVAIAGRAFRIDTNLRPEGRSGVLVRTLESYVAYWQRWARPWEFQALLKARHSAGNATVGKAFEAAASEHLWHHDFGADELAELRSMKARAESIVARRDLDQRELKRGRGGIRDIEFSVQLLQLVHGRRDPAIRLRATLACLAELADAGYVASGDAAVLALAYLFLRTVEHRLQLVEEAQVHTVPPERDARDRLARVLGFPGGVTGSPADRLGVVLARHQGAARAVHERLFFRPLLEAFAGTDQRLDADAMEDRLAAFGFRDAARTRQALDELTRGLTRSSRLMQQLLPLVLDWLSESPDPDLGLVGLRTLAGTPHRRDLLVAGFRESPELARRVCLLLGTSRRLGEIIARHPDLVASLDSDRALDAPAPDHLLEWAMTASRQVSGRRGRALRHVFEEETARIAARDVLGLSSLRETGRSLADLAGVTIAAALDAAAPGVPMAVIAMGSFGGAELAYGSDLDVLMVYEGGTPAEVEEGERAAAALFRLCNGTTPAEGIVRIDPSLRPEGRHGPLARSLDAFEQYHRRWGQTWERQALLRARPVAGDRGLFERFGAFVDETVWATPIDETGEREIRRMKARIERERIPPSEDPQFHLKLGKGSLSDVEWTVQLLQLRSGVRATGTLDAIDRLTDAGVLGPDDASVLREAYSFCSETRNRWHLVGNYLAGGMVGSGADALPHQPEQQSHLARSLGTTPAELRESYRRVTRRCRKVAERIFYGL